MLVLSAVPGRSLSLEKARVVRTTRSGWLSLTNCSMTLGAEKRAGGFEFSRLFSKAIPTTWFHIYPQYSPGLPPFFPVPISIILPYSSPDFLLPNLDQWSKSTSVGGYIQISDTPSRPSFRFFSPFGYLKNTLLVLFTHRHLSCFLRNWITPFLRPTPRISSSTASASSQMSPNNAPHTALPNHTAQTQPPCVLCSKYISIIEELSTALAPMTAPAQGANGSRSTGALFTGPVSEHALLSLPLEKDILNVFQVLACRSPLPQHQRAATAAVQLCIPCQEKIIRKSCTPMERFIREHWC